MAQTGPKFASGARMGAVFDIFMFALDRVRTVLLALSLIVMLKTVWILLTPVG
ncbi:MAG: hypothetical protein K2P70_01010 [Hyphomonadaceae bacterium]|nr:hypothetical protein [Hyphomonadaceae bacterium]